MVADWRCPHLLSSPVEQYEEAYVVEVIRCQAYEPVVDKRLENDGFKTADIGVIYRSPFVIVFKNVLCKAGAVTDNRAALYLEKREQELLLPHGERTSLALFRKFIYHDADICGSHKEA